MPNNLVSPSADAAAHGISLKQYLRTRFYLKHTLFDQSQTVTLENYQWKQDAGSHGQDFIISVNLKSYNYWGTKIINFSTDHTTGTVTQTRFVDSPPTRLNYTVIAGDDLAKIAKIKFGDASLWAKIYAENKDYIDAWHKRVGWSGSPQELFTGMILKIPPWNPNGSTY